MKILKRNLVVNKTNTKTELLYLDCGITIVFNTNYNKGNCKSEIYHCIGFDEVGNFKYNTNGISVGGLRNIVLSKGHFNLLENFFIKMQDKERYNRTINALTENYD